MIVQISISYQKFNESSTDFTLSVHLSINVQMIHHSIVNFQLKNHTLCASNVNIYIYSNAKFF